MFTEASNDKAPDQERRLQQPLKITFAGDDSYKQCCLFSDPVICLQIIVLLKHALYFRNKNCLN